jgi:hypothetical protein
MKKLLCLFAFLICTSAFAAKGAGNFKPEPSSAKGCAALGFQGAFLFSTDSQYPNIGQVVFTKTKRNFTVFRDSGNVWRMMVNGPWSESITLDFNARYLSYSSSRPGKSGVCRGSF